MEPLLSWLSNPLWMPHGICLRWNPGLVGTMVVSNAIIGLSYYSIPLALLRLLRSIPGIRFNAIFLMFAVFIFACGTSHFVDILSLWVPVYRLDAIVLVLTAGASLATAVAMWPLIPRVKAFAAAREQALANLDATNKDLQAALKESAEHQQRLMESEQQFRLALDNAPIGFAVVGLDGGFVMVNHALCSMLDYTERELLGRTFQQITYPEDLDRDLSLAQELLEGKRDSYRLEKRYLNRRGEIIYVQLDGAVLRGPGGAPLRFIAQIQNVSARKMSEVMLADSERRLQSLLDRLATAVVVHGPQTEIRYANPAACQQLGLTIDQLMGRTAIADHWHFVRDDGSRMPPEEFPVNVVARTRQPLRDYTVGVVTGPDAPSRWVTVNAEPEIGIEGQVRQIVVSFVDITERRRLARELAEQARTDPLTGLVNRRVLLESGAREFDRCRRSGADLAVLFVDLDHFKKINDLHGHACGDEVLREAASILRAGLRQVDIAARYGGEEFCLVLPDCGPADARDLGERLRAQIAAAEVRGPGADPVRFTASFGVATAGPGTRDFVELTAAADSAAYAAKAAGRNCVRSIEPPVREAVQAPQGKSGSSE